MSRWSIDDLITRYTLEPDLIDYFVEGGSDRKIYESYIAGSKRDGVILYEIDNVDIGAEDLESVGLTDGQRQRVIYLIQELERSSPGICYRGIVDRDLEDEFPTPIKSEKIIVTKYRDLESYFLSEDYLNQILVRSSGARIESWSKFYRSFLDCLMWLHSVRLADREMGAGAGRVKIRKYVEVENDTVLFKRREYILAILMSAGLGGRLEEAVSVGARWHSSFAGDPRHNIRGHDFVDLTILCLKKLSNSSTWSEEQAILAAFALSAFHQPHVLEEIF